ncbi:MAG TPA: CARDB domain-containing protein [Candidatus Krumholzibacteria bacterium]|nr:CARDB domain-containing protein [Candidatus Krumholzibacteria bacterium]
MSRIRLQRPGVPPVSLLLLVVVLATTVGVARASIRPRLDVRPVGTHMIPGPGQPVEETFALHPEIAGVFDDFAVEGEGWIALEIDVPHGVALRPGEELEFVVRGIPSGDAGPLEVVFTVDGRPTRKSLGLRPRPEHTERTMVRALEATFERSVPAPGMDTGFARPEPAPIDERFRERPWHEARPDPDAPEPDLQRRQSLTVRGSFGYLRESGPYLGADGATVRVYDADFGSDELLGTVVLGPSGNFELNVSEDETYPDIYVEFESANARVETEDSGILELNFKWKTQTYEEFSGSLLDVGALTPSNYNGQVGLHMLSTLTKGWRYLNDLGYDIPSVDAMYPVGDGGAFYDGEINLSFDRRWREDTILHEYGHHVTDTFAGIVAPSYCNGVCDGDDCGHCIWCDETPSDAWQEGFASWVGEIVQDAWPGAYGYAPAYTRSAEDIAPFGCIGVNSDPCLCGPQATEGFLWALLTDIYDVTPNEPDEDTIAGDWGDPLGMGPEEILATAANSDPTTPAAFVAAFSQAHAAEGEDLWETFVNNGWNIDQQKPGSPSGLFSTTHQIGQANMSAQPWINFVWQTAPDDWSGIGGYSYEISAGAPVPPDDVQDIPKLNNWVVTPVEPGAAYYFTLRAVDRVGRWSDDYATAGPYYIREPGPADLEVAARPGWLLPIVPLDEPSATPTSISLPDLLNGNTFFYVNLSGANDGESDAVAPFDVEFRIDGEVERMFTQTTDVAAEGGLFEFVNEPNLVVTGGLHTLEMRIDPGGAVDEQTNVNNWLANQWAFAPESISKIGPLLRPAPPDIDGGHDAMNLGQFPPVSVAKDNCDGLRLPVAQRSGADPRFVAISAHFVDAGENIDLGMYPRTTSSNLGFGWNTELASSSAPAGSIDAVVANGHAVSDGFVDVGIYNASDHVGGYYADYVESQDAVVGGTEAISFLPNEMVQMRHFDIGLSQASFVVKLAVGDDGPFDLYFFEPSTFYASLEDADTTATTDAQGEAVLEFSSTQPGKGLLVIARDPGAGAEALEVSLEIQASSGNWTLVPAPNWFDALVPLPNDFGRPGEVPAPTTLVGDLASTWLNFSVFNSSTDDAGDTFANLYYDDTCFATEVVPPIEGGAFGTFNATEAVTIPGGRHTLWVQIDPDGRVGEANETDNFFARQWVFEPQVLGLGEVTERQVPGSPRAGWEYGLIDPEIGIVGDENTTPGIDPTPFLNCDGLRLPAAARDGTAPAFMGLAVMPPQQGVDVDLKLFEASTGPEDGFDDPIAFSHAPSTTSDFVIVDLTAVEPRPFDVGIYGPEEGFEGEEVDPVNGLARAVDAQYLAHAAASVDLGSDPEGERGLYTMENNEILHLYAIELSPRTMNVRLIPQDANVDFGMALMSAQTFVGQGDAPDDARAQAVGAGEVEEFTTTISQAGVYVLAVFKDAREDAFDQGGYRLAFAPDTVTSVSPGQGVDQVIALAAPSPNPMDGSTVVAWNLRHDAHLRVEIFDARGRRVRQLVDGNLPPGRRELVWDGRDDAGRRVGRGVYLLRATAAGEVRNRKLTVIR